MEEESGKGRRDILKPAVAGATAIGAGVAAKAEAAESPSQSKPRGGKETLGARVVVAARPGAALTALSRRVVAGKTLVLLEQDLTARGRRIVGEGGQADTSQGNRKEAFGYQGQAPG